MKLDVVAKYEDRSRDEQANGLSPSIMLVAVVIGMVLFGLTMLYSTSSGIEAGPKYFVKQLAWTGVGVFAAWTIYMIGYEKLVDFSGVLLVGCCLGLIAALFFPEVNGARRWIRFGGISVQPSEFAKLALIFFTAGYLVKRQRFIGTIRGLAPLAVVCSITLVLIFVGKDMGTTILLGSTVFVMAFVAGVRLRLLLPPLLVTPPSVFFAIKYFDPMRWARLTSFLNPEHDPHGFQLWKSLLALGSGGWAGLGFNCSRMKAHYLPEAHTDFILSVVGEELGFISILIVILAYAAIVVLGFMTTFRSKDRKGLILGTGATVLIGLQAIVNLGVVSGALPTKGMPAPFISYGGSNMIVSLCCIGVILSVGAAENALE